ncbi:MAG: glycosyltransferase family 39 protein [Thermomicrobiales bacterium]
MAEPAVPEDDDFDDFPFEDEDEDEDEEEDARRLPLSTIALLAVLVVALLARFSALQHITSQIDEPASILAAREVVARGVPILPSGIPYLQGATLSYLLAPFVALGYGDLADLHALRTVSLLAGLAAVLLAFLLGRALSRQVWVGVATAALLAIDPLSIEWSAHVRMYSLLQALSLLLLLVFWRIVDAGPTRRRLALLVAVAWLGVYTHVAIVLLFPPMALMALAIHRRRLLRERRDVTLALAACAAAPLSLVALNGALGPASASSAKTVPFFSFVGEHLLSLDGFSAPTLDNFSRLFYVGNLSGIMPFVFCILTGILVGRTLLAGGEEPDGAAAEGDGDDADDGPSKRAVGFALTFFWIPILIVALVLSDQEDRYLIHLQAIGFILVALAIRALITWRPATPPPASELWQGRAVRSAGVGLVLLMTAHQLSGVSYLSQNPEVGPDYVASSLYVAERRKPGELVLTVLPPPTYLALGSAKEVMFLAGPSERDRAGRYTRVDKHGKLVDFWAGAPSIVTSAQLCDVLEKNPTAWILVDNYRLNAYWALGGDMATILRGMTYIREIGTQQTLVMRVAPINGRQPQAERLCVEAKLGSSVAVGG